MIPFALESTEWEAILGDYVEHWTAKIPPPDANELSLVSYTADAWDTRTDRTWPATPHVYGVLMGERRKVPQWLQDAVIYQVR